MPRPAKIATYYARLKVAPDAPPEVVRAAYKALVQKYHPDRHQGSLRHELVLAALNKAHEVLIDPARRAAHDQWIRDEERRTGRRAPGAGSDEAGLGLRLERTLASFRNDGLPLTSALRLHFTRGQRAGAVGMLLLLTGLIVAGALHLLARAADDPLRRLELSELQGAATTPAKPSPSR